MGLFREAGDSLMQLKLGPRKSPYLPALSQSFSLPMCLAKRFFISHVGYIFLFLMHKYKPFGGRD